MVISVTIGMFVSLAVYFGLAKVEESLQYTYYTSKEAYTASIDGSFESFREYIKENKIESNDEKKIKKWLEKNPYTYIVVYDNYGGYFENGWIAEGKSRSVKLKTAKTTISENTDNKGPRLDKRENVNGNDRIVSFADDDYYVHMELYREEGFRNIMNIVKITVAFIVVLGVVMAYTTSLTARISEISRDVTKITSGDIDGEIQTSGSDEIGILADGIDKMRNSLIQRLEGEKAARDANSRLITSMSHDIRTPLTSLVGYLDIIEGGKYQNEEELHQFIQACRNKAFQLKDLSDKLFQYFLVFGGKKSSKNYEILDGDILFQQLFSEHVAELISYGYKVDMEYEIPEKLVKIDVSSLRRLFDNIFSNIMKYADPKIAVQVIATLEMLDYKEDKEFFSFRFENRISQDAKMVESTKIGVLTCEQITKDLGGQYSWKDDDKVYVTNILLPVYIPVSSKGEDDLEASKAQEI